MTSIKVGTFNGCESLISIDIPNSVTSIGEYAFASCSGLTSINIPEGVTSIGEYAFYNCNGMTSFTISNSVTNIGEYAFSGCSSLEAVIIGSGLTSIGKDAFEGCEKLTTVTLESDAIVSETEIYDEDNDRYFIRSMANIFGDQVEEYIIGDAVKGIGYEAFYGCTGLTSITIPNSVTHIGEMAFCSCDNLATITFGNNVRSIGYYAFDETAWFENQPDGLVYAGNVAYRYKQNETEMPEDTKIELKEGTLGIAGLAFAWCYNLTSITIPESVTNIGDWAFSSCSGLTDVYCYAIVPPSASYYYPKYEEYWYAFDIDYIWEHTTLHVPEGSVEAYRTTEPWSCFRFITDGVTIIDDIEDIKAEDATNSEYYDLQGRKLNKPQKGINIIRNSDGTTRKVLVK